MRTFTHTAREVLDITPNNLLRKIYYRDSEYFSTPSDRLTTSRQDDEVAFMVIFEGKPFSMAQRAAWRKLIDSTLNVLALSLINVGGNNYYPINLPETTVHQGSYVWSGGTTLGTAEVYTRDGQEYVIIRDNSGKVLLTLLPAFNTSSTANNPIALTKEELTRIEDILMEGFQAVDLTNLATLANYSGAVNQHAAYSKAKFVTDFIKARVAGDAATPTILNGRDLTWLDQLVSRFRALSGGEGFTTRMTPRLTIKKNSFFNTVRDKVETLRNTLINEGEVYVTSR